VLSPRIYLIQPKKLVRRGQGRSSDGLGSLRL
jgi:hypothetical protein